MLVDVPNDEGDVDPRIFMMLLPKLEPNEFEPKLFEDKLLPKPGENLEFKLELGLDWWFRKPFVRLLG